MITEASRGFNGPNTPLSAGENAAIRQRRNCTEGSRGRGLYCPRDAYEFVDSLARLLGGHCLHNIFCCFIIFFLIPLVSDFTLKFLFGSLFYSGLEASWSLIFI